LLIGADKNYPPSYPCQKVSKIKSDNYFSSLHFTQRVGWIFYACLILSLGTLPIIGTYSAVSHTVDEPAHIAAGMELLAFRPIAGSSSPV